MEEKKKITAFTDLKAWKEGHKLVLMIYQQTELFPHKETFGLVNQMRRASVSITSNIAEGFSRNSIKEKSQFYSIAYGSLTELQSQIFIARDVKYLSHQAFEEVSAQSIIVAKLLSGLKRIRENNLTTKY